MALNTLNTDAISFKKLSGKVHTQQNFAVTEEGISTNVQMSYSTIFANPIVKLPITDSGLTSLYSTNGIVERVKFEIDIIPDTQIAVGRSQGYRLKLPSDYNTFGELYPNFSAGTYLYSALGKLQIVPSLYGTLKPDGSTEYDPILYQTNGSTVIAKFDPINWYLDTYSGIIFIQDPPTGYDSSASRPGYVEAFLYVGEYLDDVLAPVSGESGTTASNVGGGVGVFKEKTLNDLRFRSLLGQDGVSVSATTNNIIFKFTGNTSTVTANNGLTKTGDNIYLGGELTGNTLIGAGSSNFSIVGDNSIFELLQDGPVNIISSNGVNIADALGVGLSIQSADGLGNSVIANILPNTFTIAGPASFPGLQYDTNYSANFTTRSLVDVGFLDGRYTAINGLTKTGTKFSLGGIITGNTAINSNVANTNSFSIGATTRPNSITFLAGDVTGNNSGNITINSTVTSIARTTTNPMSIVLSTAGMVVSDLASMRGLTYADNYSANFNIRSLVDKGFVTGITSTLVSTANNGLTKSGTNIHLGGNLTGNTIINAGSRIMSFQFTGGTFNISGTTGFNSIFDTTNKRYIAGNNCQVTGGSINYTFGDNNINAGTFGSVMFGESSYIDPNIGAALAVGESVWIRAYGGKAFGRGTRINTIGSFGFIGGAWIPSGTNPKTNNKVPQVGGFGAFGFYNTDSSQTDNHGANASYSAILGGVNHNIPSGSTSSVVIGGNTIKVSTGVTNTVHLPKVRIGLGNSGSLVTNNSNNDILVRNSTTGEIEIRSALTLTGSTGSSSTQNIYSSKTIISGNTTLSGSDFVVFCQSNVTSITITLPASPTNGQVYKIKDVDNALVNNITINGNGKNIDGSSTAVINTQKGGIEIVYDQTLNAWYIMNFIG